VNIVILSSRYPSKNSPYSHMFVHTRSKEYLAQGHSVTVLVPSLNEFSYEIDGVQVLHGNVRSFYSHIDSADRVMIHLLFHRLRKEIDAGYIYNYLLKNKVPTVFFIHGVEAQTIWGSRRDDIKWFKPSSIARWLYRDLYLINRMKDTISAFNDESAPCQFVAPSQWMFQESARYTNIKITSKAQVIPNGINTQHFQFREQWHNRDKLLSIRPLIYKGKYAVDLLIDSYQKLKVPASLSLYGSGPDEDLIRSQVSGLNQFSLHNVFLEQSGIPKVHAEHGMYLAVTRMDAQGVSMCEAMASGLPTISYNTCAIPEFIEHKKTGLLANSYDTQSYTDSIEELLENRDLFESLAINARQAMEKIDIVETTKKELELVL